MTILMAQLLVLAEEAAAEAPAGNSWLPTLIMFGPPILLLLVMQTIFGRSDAKEKAKRNELVSSLRKNDPIVTIGGILGTIVSVSEDKETVTIKVDDGTRLKMQASAIQKVVSRSDKETEKKETE